MKRFVLTVLLLFCGLGFAAADYPVGYITPAGYVWKGDGYWWHGSQAYTRAQEWVPGYWTTSGYGCNACRSYVQGYYYWKYTAYYPAAAALPAYTDPGWRGKLLDIAAAREKVEGEITKNAFEQQNYLEAVRALGLTPARSPIPYVGVYGLNNLPVNYGVQGNTQYGYRVDSYNAVVTGQGPAVDLNVLYQQASQHTAGAQRLAGDANVGFQALVGAESGRAAAVREVIARGESAARLALVIKAAIDPVPQTEVRGVSFQLQQGGRVQRVEDPKQITDEQRKLWKERLAAVAEAKCVACHGDKDAKGGGRLFPGGFKIAEYFNLTNEQKNRVWEVISSNDPKVRMPFGANGGPGTPLTTDEQRAFYMN